MPSSARASAKKDRDFLFGPAGQRSDERLGLDTSRVRRPKRRRRGDMRFPLTEKRKIHNLETLHAVGGAAIAQRLQRQEPRRGCERR